MNSVYLPGGAVVDGDAPIVIIGPNGAGKTRRSREIQFDGSIEYVNALRMNSIPGDVQRIALGAARTQEEQVKAASRNQPWGWVNDADSILGMFMAEHAAAGVEFLAQSRAGHQFDAPPLTNLEQLQKLWADLFPERKIEVEDFTVRAIGEDFRRFQPSEMSDGEKAALYLAGRVLYARPGILVIDEPEMHMHSMLSARLWDLLESSRPDVRFIYITHDLTFALSRPDPIFALVDPEQGFKILEFGQPLPVDVAESLLGAASLSFRAKRIGFCEGNTESSLDNPIFKAWFRDRSTVVRPVSGCERVMRCVEALREANITTSLQAIGIIDRDYNADRFFAALPDDVRPLPFHELESLLCLTAVVEAVGKHLGSDVSKQDYEDRVIKSINEDVIIKTTLERWKRSVEPLLTGLVSSARTKRIEELKASIPNIFNSSSWNFSPEEILEEEESRLRGALANRNFEAVLTLFPGKPLLEQACMQLGLKRGRYLEIITGALGGREPGLANLGEALATVLEPYLPPRFV